MCILKGIQKQINFQDIQRKEGPTTKRGINWTSVMNMEMEKSLVSSFRAFTNLPTFHDHQNQSNG